VNGSGQFTSVSDNTSTCASCRSCAKLGMSCAPSLPWSAFCHLGAAQSVPAGSVLPFAARLRPGSGRALAWTDENGMRVNAVILSSCGM
jgi:hypothetical protein